MRDRKVGTEVHTAVTSNDPAALLPLQEALGYDLAQSLFANQRNLVLEGLTDQWYVESTAALLTSDGSVKLNDRIALDVWSRQLVERVYPEAAGLGGPCFADSLVGREAT